MSIKYKQVDGLSGYFESSKAGSVMHIPDSTFIHAKAGDFPDQTVCLEPTPPKETTRYSLVTKTIPKLKRKFWPYAPKHKMSRDEAKNILHDLRTRIKLPVEVDEAAIDTMIEKGIAVSKNEVHIIQMERDV